MFGYQWCGVDSTLYCNWVFCCSACSRLTSSSWYASDNNNASFWSNELAILTVVWMREYCTHESSPVRAIACLSLHAGYQILQITVRTHGIVNYLGKESVAWPTKLMVLWSVRSKSRSCTSFRWIFTWCSLLRYRGYRTFLCFILSWLVGTAQYTWL